MSVGRGRVAGGKWPVGSWCDGWNCWEFATMRVDRLSGEGVVPAQVAAVPGREAAGAVHADRVLVVLEHLHYGPRLVPFRGVAAGLVLYEDRVAAAKGGQAVCVIVPPGSALGESLRDRLFPLHSLFHQLGLRLEASGDSGEQVSHVPAKEASCWGHAGVWAGVVSIL